MMQEDLRIGEMLVRRGILKKIEGMIDKVMNVGRVDIVKMS